MQWASSMATIASFSLKTLLDITFFHSGSRSNSGDRNTTVFNNNQKSTVTSACIHYHTKAILCLCNIRHVMDGSTYCTNPNITKLFYLITQHQLPKLGVNKLCIVYIYLLIHKTHKWTYNDTDSTPTNGQR